MEEYFTRFFCWLFDLWRRWFPPSQATSELPPAGESAPPGAPTVIVSKTAAPPTAEAAKKQRDDCFHHLMRQVKSAPYDVLSDNQKRRVQQFVGFRARDVSQGLTSEEEALVRALKFVELFTVLLTAFEASQPKLLQEAATADVALDAIRDAAEQVVNGKLDRSDCAAAVWERVESKIPGFVRPDRIPEPGNDGYDFSKAKTEVEGYYVEAGLDRLLSTPDMPWESINDYSTQLVQLQGSNRVELQRAIVADFAAQARNIKMIRGVVQLGSEQ